MAFIYSMQFNQIILAYIIIQQTASCNYICQNNIPMSSTTPNLSFAQVEELTNMIRGIEEDNQKPLQHLLEELVEVESTSILSLYQLVCMEWVKKQKIIDNLCHFSLTMMNTLNLLRDQKADQDDRLSQNHQLICELQNSILGLREQSEKCKMEMKQKLAHLELVQKEKEKFEELYRTQSTCNFQANSSSGQQQASSDTPKQCLDCRLNRSLLEEEKKERSDEWRRALNQQEEIANLQRQKKELKKKCDELVEECQLAKMEIELAEMAVKDALSLREASFSGRSQAMSRSYILNTSDEIYTSKSQAQFMNGELQCFSNLDESFNLEHKIFESDFKQCSISSTVSEVSPSNPELTLSEQDARCTETHEPVPSAFKKKGNQHKNQKLLTEGNEPHDDSNDLFSFKQVQSKISKNKKTVSLQCNLLKNVPRLRLLPRRALPVKAADSQGTVVGMKEKQALRKPALVGSKSQIIIKPNFSRIENFSQKGSLGRLLSFFSNKIIASRIKTK